MNGRLGTEHYTCGGEAAVEHELVYVGGGEAGFLFGLLTPFGEGGTKDPTVSEAFFGKVCSKGFDRFLGGVLG